MFHDNSGIKLKGQHNFMMLLFFLIKILRETGNVQTFTSIQTCWEFSVLIYCIHLDRTLHPRPPSLSFTSDSCQRIRREFESASFEFSRPTTSQSMYNDVMNRFLRNAKERKSAVSNEIESWERFIPESLRLV